MHQLPTLLRVSPPFSLPRRSQRWLRREIFTRNGFNCSFLIVAKHLYSGPPLVIPLPMSGMQRTQLRKATFQPHMHYFVRGAADIWTVWMLCLIPLQASSIQTQRGAKCNCPDRRVRIRCTRGMHVLLKSSPRHISPPLQVP